MVDALHVEHSFAHALGIGESQRNDVNDAAIFLGKLAHFARNSVRSIRAGIRLQ